MNLTREHFRAMIFYNFKLSLTPKQCEERLRNAFCEKAPWAPSKATIYNWYTEFKRDRFFLRDEFREGGPRTAVADENIAAVRAMLEEVRRTSYEFIRATLVVGMSQIQNILLQQLDVKKICYRWKRTTHWMVQKNSEKIQRPHFKFDLEYLAPCDFFFFPKIKNNNKW
jgi:hypothetical protein